MNDAPSPSPGLRGYCDTLAAALAAKGYRLVHACDLKSAHACIHAADPDLRRHARQQIALARAWHENGYDGLMAMQNDVLAGRGAYCDPTAKIIVLPDEAGLLHAFAKTHGLSMAKLHADGLTDLHLYAEYFIHEASHVMGNDGWAFTDASFLRGEFQVHALAAARFLKADGGPSARAAMRLFAAAKFTNPFMVHPSHAWSLNATDWVLARIGAGPADDIWRRDGNGFTAQAFNRFSRFGDPQSDRTALRAEDPAFNAINRHGALPLPGLRTDPRLRYAMRDAALDAANDLKHQARAGLRAGKPDPALFQARLLLRQMGRSLDTLLRYADDYYARGQNPDPPRLPKSILDFGR